MIDSAIILVAVGGYILLHSSQCQPKNTTSIVIANLLSLAVGITVFAMCGYAFAIGGVNVAGSTVTDSSNFFLSHKRFFLMEASDQDFRRFESEAVLLALVIVLINAGFIARMRHWLYPIVAIFTGGFLYPCVRHWTNHVEGWLKDGIEVDNKTIDYEDWYGAGCIHVFVGSVALISTVLLSPRNDRTGKKFGPVGGNLTPLILIGGILAIVGTMAKNGSFVQSLSFINNILAAQGSAMVAYAMKRTGMCGDRSGSKALINGALAGLVGVSCLANNYQPYGGFVIGVVSGIAYVAWSALLQLCHVDDPTDTVSVHLGAGLWAVLAGPMFKRKVGCLYNGDKDAFQKFGWHLLGGIAIFVWAGLTYFLVLLLFVCTGIARYRNIAASDAGLDAYEHKEPAYPDREQYTQDVEDGVLDDIMKPDHGKAFMNGSFENNPNRATRQTAQPVTLEYRNDQHWKNTRY